ncbi:hypothetical protein BD410DRAFT_894079, partial [Rickenella mellea]
MHRRKKSREDDGETVPFPQEHQQNGVNVDGDDGHARTRVSSTPSQPPKLPPSPYTTLPPSAGPYRTTFGSPGGVGLGQPYSPLRPSFSHARTQSTSGVPLSMRDPGRPSPSPRTASFPTRSNSIHESTLPTSMSPSVTAPAIMTNGASSTTITPASPQQQHTRRHSRIHSRNLSIFFPRPGALPHTAIAEDGAQELEYSGPIDEESPVSAALPTSTRSAAAPVQLHSPPAPRSQLGEGFTFGGRPPPASSSPAPGTEGSLANRPKRRGHHHKHSVSHNFFSFLEPGSQTQSQSQMQTTPTMEPASPWNPTPTPSTGALSPSISDHMQNGVAVLNPSHHDHPEPSSVPGAISVVQFLLGASLWVSGQQSGSLGCTGLGYWVVFDAFGVALGHVLPAYLALRSGRDRMRRAYGNARIETLMLFSQSVYLIFSSVYVCKETVEHLLLSAGEGHHHHRGDEDLDTTGIPFPTFLILITLISLISTSLFYNNHTKLIEAAGHRLPSFLSFPFLRSSSRRSNYGPSSPHASATMHVLANPFT